MPRPKNSGLKRSFKNAKEFEERINEFLDKCEEDGKAFTLVGLAIHCGISKGVLCEIGKQDEYSKLYARAKDYSENNLVQGALANEFNATLASLILKSHFGYSDKQEIKQDITADVTQKVVWE